MRFKALVICSRRSLRHKIDTVVAIACVHASYKVF